MPSKAAGCLKMENSTTWKKSIVNGGRAMKKENSNPNLKFLTLSKWYTTLNSIFSLHFTFSTIFSLSRLFTAQNCELHAIFYKKILLLTNAFTLTYTLHNRNFKHRTVWFELANICILFYTISLCQTCTNKLLLTETIVLSFKSNIVECCWCSN